MRGITLRNYERKFRSDINSEDLNRNFREIYDDISEAFTRYQFINNKLSQHVYDMMYENQMLQSRIEGLESDISSLSDDTNILYWSAYSDNEVIEITGKQNIPVGNVTLDWSRNWTKMQITVNEWGEYEAGNAVRIAVDEGSGESYVDKPDDIYNAFDNNPGTNWIAAYPTGESPSEIIVRVELPPSINPSINTLYVSPFPDEGPTVTKIEYLTVSDSWVEFTTDDIKRKTRIHFSPVDYNNQIKITMEPVTLINEELEDVNVFGLQDVEVGFIEYNNTGYIVLKLDAADSISKITSVDLDYNITPSVNESIDHPVVVEIYEESALTTRCYSSLSDGHPFEGSISLSTPSASLYVKVTLDKINNTTPVIKGITVGIELE